MIRLHIFVNIKDGNKLFFYIFLWYLFVDFTVIYVDEYNYNWITRNKN